MFDPHKSTYRNKRVSHKGQIIQCRPMTPPFTFEMKTWKKYEAWAKKNNLIPNEPPSDDSYIIKIGNENASFASNMLSWNIPNIKQLSIWDNASFNTSITASPGQMAIIWFSNIPFSDINYNQFNCLCFYTTILAGVSYGFEVNIIVDTIAKKSIIKVGISTSSSLNYLFCNMNEDTISIPSQENPCIPVNSENIEWITEDPNIENYYFYIGTITVRNASVINGQLINVPDLVAYEPREALPFLVKYSH